MMMRRILLSIAIVVFLIMQPIALNAQTVLAERTFSGGGTRLNPPFDDTVLLSAFVCTEAVFPGTCQYYPNTSFSFGVFDRLSVSESDVGTIFNVSVDQSAAAAGAAALLTNGINDLIMDGTQLPNGPGSARETRESSFFNGNPFSTNGIDLAGQQIGGFDLSIDELTIDNDNGTFLVTATWSIISEPVPEPSTTTLGLMSLVMLGARRRRSL